MFKKKWFWSAVLVLPIAVSGLVFGQSLTKSAKPKAAAGYVCPLTGEELPCPSCCPMNQPQ